MRTATFIMVLSWFYVSSVASQITFKKEQNDLPPNPKAGHCYVRCFDTKQEIQKVIWKDVDCFLVRPEKLAIKLNGMGRDMSLEDMKYLKKELKPFLQKENIMILEIISSYGSDATKAVNTSKATERAVLVAEYLVTLGMNKDYLKIRTISTEKYTGFSYRALSASIKN